MDPRLGLNEDTEDANEDEDVLEMMESPKDVYVGGPAAICAAAMQAKFGQGSDVFYFHDGQRGSCPIRVVQNPLENEKKSVQLADRQT